MRLERVQPRRWSNIRMLFNDGDHGIVSGNYDGDERRVIGLRYNGAEDELGYPNARGYPTFFQFFPIPALEFSLFSALENSVVENEELREKYAQTIREEFAIFKQQHIQEIERNVRAQLQAEYEEVIARRIQEEIQKRIGGTH